jgi:hypothetical protein
MTPSSNNEITMTDLPVVKPKPGRMRVGSESEITLAVAWRVPADSLIILNEGSREEEWVRVTDSVGNGPYQVTVTRLTTSQRWSARLRYRLGKLTSKWKYRVWWPVVDGLEDAARFLGESWRRRI